MTKVHCQKLHEHVFQSLRSAMLDDGDELFEPRLKESVPEDGNNGDASTGR